VILIKVPVLIGLVRNGVSLNGTGEARASIDR